MKKDPLFKKEAQCKTCVGFGKLVTKPCGSCDGKGIRTEKGAYVLEVPRFSVDGDELEIQDLGDQSSYQLSSTSEFFPSGKLKIKLNVTSSPDFFF